MDYEGMLEDLKYMQDKFDQWYYGGYFSPGYDSTETRQFFAELESFRWIVVHRVVNGNKGDRNEIS